MEVDIINILDFEVVDIRIGQVEFVKGLALKGCLLRTKEVILVVIVVTDLDVIRVDLFVDEVDHSTLNRFCCDLEVVFEPIAL